MNQQMVIMIGGINLNKRVYADTAIEAPTCDNILGFYRCGKLAYNVYNGKNYCDGCYEKIKGRKIYQ